MSDKRKFSFIINPEAGRGKTRGLADVLHSLLKARNVGYEILKSRGKNDATELAREASKVSDFVVAVGGDGTANEVANGITGSRASLGVIPAGSGNDFSMMLGMSTRIERSLDDILECRMTRIDIGTARLKDIRGREQTRIFVNTIGIGFDAVVAYESQRIKWLNGVPLYMLAVFRSLRKLTPHTFEVTVGNQVQQEDYYLVCVGNGDREGGGFFVTPGADPKDGIFRVCTVKQVSLLRALRILPTILKGEHGRFPEVSFFDTERIQISSRRPFTVHCDGEIIGTDNGSADVEVNPGSLSVIVGRSGRPGFL